MKEAPTPTCDDTSDNLVREVSCDEDPREADAHLDAPKQGPEADLQVPAKTQKCYSQGTRKFEGEGAQS